MAAKTSLRAASISLCAGTRPPSPHTRVTSDVAAFVSASTLAKSLTSLFAAAFRTALLGAYVSSQLNRREILRRNVGMVLK